MKRNNWFCWLLWTGTFILGSANAQFPRFSAWYCPAAVLYYLIMLLSSKDPQ